MPKKGRPLKFESVEELKTAKDGLVSIDYGLLNTKEFKKEKNLLEFIVENIDMFVESILEDTLFSFETEYQFNKQLRFSPRDRRVDLYVICKKYKYIIELKNPTNLAENRLGIGQLLDYGRECSDLNKKLILITTRFDINTAKTIKFYNLPIRYIYLDKLRIMEYLKNE